MAIYNVDDVFIIMLKQLKIVGGSNLGSTYLSIYVFVKHFKF